MAQTNRMVIMQGDSYPVLIRLTQDGVTLTPDMVDDVEICVGQNLRKTAANGEVGYDSNLQHWYIIPSQEETFAMGNYRHDVIARVKYKGSPEYVKGICVGDIKVMKTISTEVL